MTKNLRLLVLALAALLTTGLSGCGDDDDDGTGTDADTDADADSDADSDTDSDTDVAYDGVLNAEIMGASVQVWTQFSTDLDIGWTIRYWATEGNVNNIEVGEVRVLIDDEVFLTIPQEDIILAGMDFDGIVATNTEKTISYTFQKTTQEGFQDHCAEIVEFEIDLTFNDGETLNGLLYGGTPTDVVSCVES